MARIPFAVNLVEVSEAPVYQQIAARALHLRQLGMSFEEIGCALGVSHVTAAKAARWEGQ